MNEVVLALPFQCYEVAWAGGDALSPSTLLQGAVRRVDPRVIRVGELVRSLAGCGT